jgi:hypothetical protein
MRAAGLLQRLENQSHFFPSFSSVSRPNRPEISSSVLTRFLSPRLLIRQWQPPPQPPQASSYASSPSSSGSPVRPAPFCSSRFSFFSLRKNPLFFSISFFLRAWINWFLTFLFVVVSSRVEEADLVLHAAVESQRRLHRL